MGELAYEATLWGIRGQVARDAARELEELRNALSWVMRGNYLGAGCVEGVELYGRLKGLLVEAAGGIEGAGVESARLAGCCQSAIAQLETADRDGVNVFDAVTGG